MNEKSFSLRIVTVLVMIVTGFSVLSWRLIHVQLKRHEHYSSVLEQRHVTEEKLPARRGSLYDRKGELLASDKPVRDVVVDLNHLNHLDHIVRAMVEVKGMPKAELLERNGVEELRVAYIHYVAGVLAVPLGLSFDEIHDKIGGKRKSGEVVLFRGLEEDVGEQLALDLKNQLVRGVQCRKAMSRHYSTSQLGHVIGFADRDRIGKEGVERAMEEQLTGRDGSRRVSRDRRGEEILAFRGEVTEPRHGNSVHLTIDMRIQEITERALDAAFEEFTPLKAMAVVIRPSTGEVLAMANRPDFDRSTMRGNLRNFSVEAVYEPGSTFKIVPVGGAFDRDLVSLTTRIFCHHGLFEAPDLPVALKDSHPYGELTVAGILAKSSNIGTYKLSSQLGRKGLSFYISSFGFGSRTGIELTGESRGIVHPAERWSLTSMSRIGMGYEVAVTPLQMAMAMGAVANGGVLMQPTVISAVCDEDGRAVSEFRPTKTGQPVSAHASELLREALSQATDAGGTGTKAQVDGWSVAGKTGTAQRYDDTQGRYVDGSYVVSFAGYAPRESPELAVVVVVDDPIGDSLFGGTIAAPVFAKIVGPSLDYLSIQGATTGSAVASSTTNNFGGDTAE